MREGHRKRRLAIRDPWEACRGGNLGGRAAGPKDGEFLVEELGITVFVLVYEFLISWFGHPETLVGGKLSIR